MEAERGAEHREQDGRGRDGEAPVQLDRRLPCACGVGAAEILGVRRPGDPLTARTYNNLGRALYTTREFAEARGFHAAALEIRQRRLGREHPDTATSLTNLAAVARAEGDLPGARALFERTMSAFIGSP